MTQPAKAQEPSMEEILASIRRIIADDEGKPAAAASKPAASAAKPEPVKPAPAKPETKVAEIKPAAVSRAAEFRAAAKQGEPKAAVPRAEPEPEPEPELSGSNSQDEIDAMLAGLDAETSEDEVRAPQQAPDEADDVFDLTEDMALAEEPAFQRIAPQDDLEFSEPPRGDQPREAPRAPEQAAQPGPAQRDMGEAIAEDIMAQAMPLASAATVASVNSAFNTLAHTVLSQNARTLEDLVREMLRPMLRAWLDDNLPGLVERLVKAEIERVSRGR